MNNILILVLSALIPISGLFGQNIMTVPAISLPVSPLGVVVPGTVASVQLANANKRPITFLILSADSAHPYRYLNDSTYNASIVPAFNGDSIDFIKDLYMNELKVKKSIYFTNHEVIFNPSRTANATDAYRYLTSKIASDVSLLSRQCWTYSQLVFQDLASLPNSPVVEDSSISFGGHNVLGATIGNERGILIDADPGEPGGVQPDPKATCGWLSVYDAVKDTSRIVHIYYYQGGAGTDSNLCRWMTMSQYRALFASGIYRSFPISNMEPHPSRGAITLCAQCSITLGTDTVNKMIIDPMNPVIGKIMNSPDIRTFAKALKRGLPWAVDSAISALARAYPLVTEDSISKWVTQNQIDIISSYMKTPKVLRYQVPPNHRDTIFMGEYSQIYAPFFVRDIYTHGGGIVLKDSLITGEAHYKLYGPSGSDGPGYISDTRAITLLDRGFIPPGVGADFDLYYNQLLFPVRFKNLKIDLLGGSGLQIRPIEEIPKWTKK